MSRIGGVGRGGIASVVVLIGCCLAAAPARAVCVGDCDGNRKVSVNELVTGVNIALGALPVEQCAALDCESNGHVPVNCLVQGVNDALRACPSNVQNPTVEGPVSGGNGVPFVASTMFDLADVGYEQAEYFFAGTAAAYINVGALTPDGMWTAAPGNTAAYKTRMLVYRPTDAANFHGTVVVEWLNVSGGLDSGADWLMGHVQLIRDGVAYVGVSAQFDGVEGGGSVVGLPPMPLKMADPQRYGSLVHPGDAFSYDIFSQAAQAIRQPAGISPLGDLPIERIIAIGESQSAFRLVTYIDAVHPLADVYDGFLVHSRGSIGAALSQSPEPDIPVPGTAPIRADVNVPVLIFETESDLGFLNYVAARQDDSEHVRVWEVAGTAHADAYTTVIGFNDLGDSPDAARLVETTMPVPLPGFVCPAFINSGPQHYVLNAALAALNSWVRAGTPPPTAPRLQVEGSPPTIARDAHGNALGGIRTPQLDAPIATLRGDGQSGSILCLLFGTTARFDAATLAALYPDHAAYVSAFNAAADQAVQAGFLVAADAELMKAAAASSDIGDQP